MPGRRAAMAMVARWWAASAPLAWKWVKWGLLNEGWCMLDHSVVPTHGLLTHVSEYRHRVTWIGIGAVHEVVYGDGCYPMYEPGYATD